MSKRYSLQTQISEVERELAQRATTYKRMVSSRAMRQADADLKIEIMHSVLATLRWLQKNEAAIKATLNSGAGAVDNPP